jgi:hypothetical protein
MDEIRERRTQSVKVGFHFLSDINPTLLIDQVKMTELNAYVICDYK